jgi:hypothetical protein
MSAEFIEAVIIASEVFGNAPNMWDLDCAMLGPVRRRTVISPWLHKKKVMLSLYQAMEAHRVMRR